MIAISSCSTVLVLVAALSQFQDISAVNVDRKRFESHRSDSQGAFENFLKAPKWVRESNIAGFARWECGHILNDVPLHGCDNDAVAAFRQYTHVLNENVGNLSQVANSVFLMAENTSTGMTTCIKNSFAFGEASASVHNPLRVIIDAQYINRPRCCHGVEVEGLVLNDEGENYPWTNDALQALENVTEAGLSFYRAVPTQYPCTKDDPCPLVIQIAGAAGNPWFLIQNHCSTCQKELGAVIIAPFLEKDIFLDDGAVAGSSNEVLETTLVPFIETYLESSPEIDARKVYVVAQSQGDDTALRLALLRPDLIAMVSLAGKNAINKETMAILQSPEQILRIQSSRLAYIQWNVGDEDTAFEDSEYFRAFVKQIRTFTPGLPRLDLRIYPQSFHSVWWAAWNSLHEVIWTGQRSAAEAAAGIVTTCRGAESMYSLD